MTGKSSKVLIGYRSISQRKKSMTVSDNTIQAEDLGDVFKILDKNGINISKKWQKLFPKILPELSILQTTLPWQQLL